MTDKIKMREYRLLTGSHALKRDSGLPRVVRKGETVWLTDREALGDALRGRIRLLADEERERQMQEAMEARIQAERESARAAADSEEDDTDDDEAVVDEDEDSDDESWDDYVGQNDAKTLIDDTVSLESVVDLKAMLAAENRRSKPRSTVVEAIEVRLEDLQD